MGVLEIIGGVLLMLASVLIIGAVVVQESKQSGLSGMNGESTDSYLSKNRGRTSETKLLSLTKILIVVFFLVTVGLNLAIKYMG